MDPTRAARAARALACARGRHAGRPLPKRKHGERHPPPHRGLAQGEQQVQRVVLRGDGVKHGRHEAQLGRAAQLEASRRRRRRPWLGGGGGVGHDGDASAGSNEPLDRARRCPAPPLRRGANDSTLRCGARANSESSSRQSAGSQWVSAAPDLARRHSGAARASRCRARGEGGGVGRGDAAVCSRGRARQGWGGRGVGRSLPAVEARRRATDAPGASTGARRVGRVERGARWLRAAARSRWPLMTPSSCAWPRTCPRCSGMPTACRLRRRAPSRLSAASRATPSRARRSFASSTRRTCPWRRRSFARSQRSASRGER